MATVHIVQKVGPSSVGGEIKMVKSLDDEKEEDEGDEDGEAEEEAPPCAEGAGCQGANAGMVQMVQTVTCASPPCASGAGGEIQIVKSLDDEKDEGGEAESKVGEVDGSDAARFRKARIALTQKSGASQTSALVLAALAIQACFFTFYFV
jgi:hypothetical protein